MNENNIITATAENQITDILITVVFYTCINIIIRNIKFDDANKSKKLSDFNDIILITFILSNFLKEKLIIKIPFIKSFKSLSENNYIYNIDIGYIYYDFVITAILLLILFMIIYGIYYRYIPYIYRGGNMMIKARKVGNSTILTVPSTFEIKDGEEYEVYQTDSGKIIYEPKDRNIFEGDWFNEDLTQDELFIKEEIYDSEWSEPKKGDIITLDFEPSVGREIKKRRPALVVSNSKYSKLTGLLVIVPITSKPNTKMIEYGIYQEVKHNKVRGYINPLQFHTFDYKKWNVKYIGKIDKDTLKKVLKLINNIIKAKEL